MRSSTIKKEIEIEAKDAKLNDTFFFSDRLQLQKGDRFELILPSTITPHLPPHLKVDSKSVWAVFLIHVGDGNYLEHTFNGDEAIKALAIGPKVLTFNEVMVTTPRSCLSLDIVRYGLVGEAVEKILDMIPYFL